jgi:hypothetical protein
MKHRFDCSLAQGHTVRSSKLMLFYATMNITLINISTRTITRRFACKLTVIMYLTLKVREEVETSEPSVYKL